MRMIITDTAKAIAFKIARVEYERTDMQAKGHTQKAKRIDLDKFEEFLWIKCGDDLPLLLDVTRATIEEFIEHRLRVEAVSTVRRRYATVRHFCRRMSDTFPDFRNPCHGIRGPRIDRSEPVQLTGDEKKRLRAAIVDADRCYTAARNAIILELGLLQALRCQEIADLCLVHVDTQRGSLIKFRGKGMKFCDMKLHPRLHKMLLDYDRIREHLLTARLPHYQSLPEAVRLQFPYLISLTGAKETDLRSFGLNVRTINRIVRVAAEKAKIDCWPHKLRHTAIGDFHQLGGCDLYKTAKYARHSDVNTTMIYAGSSANQIYKTMEEM